jgi:hypothetical protein
MKHIPSSNIASITTTSEDSDFLLESVLDNHPSRLYKAISGVSSVVLTATINVGVSAVMIAGSNATSASILAYDINEVAWGDSDLWGDSDVWANAEVGVTGYTVQRSSTGSIWIELTETIDRPITLEITLTTASGTTLEAGVLTANISNTYSSTEFPANPNFGLTESRVDYSIKARYSNGARYYKKGDIVRQFAGTVEMERDEFYTLMTVYDTYGEIPSGWKLTDIESNNWVVLALMDGPPRGVHDTPNGVSVELKLLEVV